MCGRRKGAHIGADLGDDGLDRDPSEPWHFVQSFDDIAKGRECGLAMRASKAATLSSNCSIVRRCCARRKRWCSRITAPQRLA